MTQTRRLIAAWLVLVAIAATGLSLAHARWSVPLGAIQGQIVVPHSAWLARCEALPIEALEGLEIVKATVRQDRVSALLRHGTRMGWLQCHRMGVYAAAPVYACYGPTVLRGRMAEDPACSHAIAWTAVKALPAAVKNWIAARSTCCGTWTVGGAEHSAVPCTWVVSGKATGTLAGYGPGVVGSDSPCAAYAE